MNLFNVLTTSLAVFGFVVILTTGFVTIIGYIYKMISKLIDLTDEEE